MTNCANVRNSRRTRCSPAEPLRSLARCARPCRSTALRYRCVAGVLTTGCRCCGMIRKSGALIRMASANPWGCALIMIRAGWRWNFTRSPRVCGIAVWRHGNESKTHHDPTSARLPLARGGAGDGNFALAATGFTIALQKAADASDMAAREMQVTRMLQSSLDAAISIPVLEEGDLGKTGRASDGDRDEV